MELTAEEIRVLGCLVEKQLTTPQAYPLTESAIVAACNQTTNREPVVHYDQTTVRRALLSLRQQGLAKMIHRSGDRVEKHRHLFDEALSLSPGEVAVLTVLGLRGPQTVGELRTRTERLHPFGSLSEVEEVLTALAARSPEPLVERMPRQPGQKEARTRHLLGGEFDVSAAAGSAPADPQGVPLPSEGAEPPASTPSRAEVEAVHVLQSRVLLRPASFDASVAFYEQTLGLTRYREWGGEPARGVVYFLGGGYLELSESPAPVAPSGVRLWLQVADVAAAARQLTSAGARVLAPPRREPWGLIEMTVADPDGLELVVVEVPDDHPLRRDTRS